MLLRIISVIWSLSIGLAFAGAMGAECEKTQVTTPCPQTNWEISAKALYMHIYMGGDSSARNYATTVENAIQGGITPKWGVGFELNGGYHFDRGSDISANWSHWDRSTTKTRQSVAAFPASVLNLPGNISGLVTVNELSSTVRPRWDAVNLEFGQLIEFDPHRTIRPFAGISYVRILAGSSTTVNAMFTPDSGGALVPYSSYNLISLAYNGVGPRVGGDLQFDWRNGLAFYIDGAVAVFVGSSKYSDFQSINHVTINGTNSIAVPEVEAKIGGSYSFPFPFVSGKGSINAGWTWVAYMGPLSESTTSLLKGPTNVNFNIQGGYLGLTWVGEIG